MRTRNKISPQLSFCGYLFGALLILLLPLKWLLAGVFAALFHEVCHWAAILLCGKQVTKISIHDNGVTMEAADLLPWQELVCSLAGPAGSLFLLSFSRRFPILGICALVQGGFNLLPLFPLDGGRALKCAARMLWGTRGESVFRVLQRIAWGIALLLLGYLAISLRCYLEMALLLVFLAVKHRSLFFC